MSNDDLFHRNRTSSQLNDFYTDWSTSLTDHFLPPLRDSPSDATNDAVLNHLRSYYDTLDYYANNDNISFFLFPQTTPFLFLGDINPLLFTALITSFRDTLNQDPENSKLAAWRYLSDMSLHNIDAIKYNVKETVSALQGRFTKLFSDHWVSKFRAQQGRQSVAMGELVKIFVDANKLRRTTIKDIVAVLDLSQGALFLEGVCQFLGGLRSPHQVAHIPAQGPPHGQLFQPNAPSQNMMQPQHPPEQRYVIYIGNLALEATPDMLRQRFSHYHSVKETKICDGKGGRHNYGFVSFADQREKWHAMKHMNNEIFLDRPMHVGPADKNAIM